MELPAARRFGQVYPMQLDYRLFARSEVDGRLFAADVRGISSRTRTDEGLPGMFTEMTSR
jgi:hypothetical protein